MKRAHDRLNRFALRMRVTWLAVVVVGIVLNGCRPVPIALRADINNIPLTHQLQGMETKIVRVRDLRSDPEILGRHRDGTSRYLYQGGTNLRSFVRKLAELSLLANGATLSDADDADIRVEIDIIEAEVRTKGALVNRVTEGNVVLAFRFLNNKDQIIGERIEKRPFHQDNVVDRGILGDVIRDAVGSALAQLKPTEASEADVESELVVTDE